MKRIIPAITAAVLLVFAPAALAHHVTSASLACTSPLDGTTTLTVNYAAFVPVSGHRFPITATFTDGSVSTFTPPSDAGTLTEPGPAVANGSSLGVTLTWHNGSFTVPPAVFNCQPPPPPPPPPPVVVPPAPTPPVAPPAAVPPPPVIPPTPVPPSPPKRHHPPHRCVPVRIGAVHATIGPQGLMDGAATLKAGGPSSVKRISVTVFDDYGRRVSTHGGEGNQLTLRLDVTDVRIWGVYKPSGSTYGVHRIVVTFVTPCSRVTRTLDYNNQDAPISLDRHDWVLAASWS